MIYLTKNQLEEIAQQLAAISVKDSDFDLTTYINDDDFVAIVQNGINKRVLIETLREGIARGDKGDPGNGIESVSIDNDGYLTFTFTDGTEWTSSIPIKGEDGQDGAPGVGVPAGGSAGQVLAKSSGSDYATEWVTPSTGSDLDALRDWSDYDGTDIDQVLGSNLGKALKDAVDAILEGYIFKGVASTSTNPGTVTRKTAYLAGAGTYSNFTSGGTAITVPEGNIGVLTWNNGWSVTLLEVGSGGGGDLNYEIITDGEYAAKRSAGTLEDVLYIILDDDTSPLA